MACGLKVTVQRNEHPTGNNQATWGSALGKVRCVRTQNIRESNFRKTSHCRTAILKKQCIFPGTPELTQCGRFLSSTGALFQESQLQLAARTAFLSQ